MAKKPRRIRSVAPTTPSIRATAGTGRCRRPGTCRWTSRSASTSGGCTPIASARVRQALAGSGLGALLVFDQYNIRYISSTVIGEWARDKLTRWCLLTGNGEPWVWDFGSAARHHRLYAPWIPEKQSLAGHRRACAARSRRRPGSSRRRRRRSATSCKAEGVADMPLGIDVVEPPFLFALQELGIEVRDGAAGDARGAR